MLFDLIEKLIIIIIIYQFKIIHLKYEKSSLQAKQIIIILVQHGKRIILPYLKLVTTMF